MSCKPMKHTCLPFLIVIITLHTSMLKCQLQRSDKIIHLRTVYKTLSKVEVKQLLIEKGFFDRYWNKSGDFKNQFTTNMLDNKKIIVDKKTGLMWLPSGSKHFVSWEKAKKWICDINEQTYAGFSDWRLPTLEEALSLLESRKKRLYVDPKFDDRQWCIWTGDKLDTNLAWVVIFSGRVDWFDTGVGLNYVRPVRTQ